MLGVEYGKPLPFLLSDSLSKICRDSTEAEAKRHHLAHVGNQSTRHTVKSWDELTVGSAKDIRCCCCCFLLSVQSELDFVAEHRAELKIGFLYTMLDSLEITVL